MVLTREMRDEIESVVNEAVNIKSELFFKSLVNKVAKAVIKILSMKLSHLKMSVADLQNKHTDMETDY